jgi:ATP-binding cassette subfamily A (ABC1) protein 3
MSKLVWYANIYRPDLTVKEHIRIFSDLKCLTDVNNELASGVDLLKKLNKKAKTLSGGQKRKLQMAIMFAGTSSRHKFCSKTHANIILLM